MLITKNAITYEVEPGTAINDTTEYWDAVNAGSWEPETFDILQTFLSKDHSYFDIGAWVGPTVLFGAQLSKKCYAFEPDPVAFAALLKNLSINPGISNVHAQQAAISSSTGVVQMGSRGSKGDSMSGFLWSQETWTVQSFALKDYFEQNKIDDCNFIKMDIEGGEAIVLSDNKDFFKDVSPTLYLSLHTPWIVDKPDFFSKISESLSVYKNIYLPHGQLLSLSDIPNITGFQAIIATNEVYN